MKRDMDLIRHILLEIEAAPPTGGWAKITSGGYNDETIGATIGLLAQGGYVEANDARSHSSPNQWMPKRLTWQGHDLLDDIRNETVWQKTKERLAAVGGTASIEVVKAVAAQVARTMLGV